MIGVAERLAERLRAEHSDAEPLEVDADRLAGWIAAAGGDPDDATLVAAIVEHWEMLLL